MSILHGKNVTIADFTGTVTVFNSAGATVTANATDIVRPSDWVSAHNQFYTLTGNTNNASTASGTNVVLSGGNGVTLVGSNSVIGFSVATNYQSQGAYLTTARASNDAIGLNTALTANGVSVTANSSGLSLNFPAFLTTQSGQAFSADAMSAFQTLVFQNSNGVSFSNNAGSLRVTHDLQFTSATSAITSNALHSSASRVVNVVAATNSTGGGTASLSGNVSFSNANGLTFYTSAGGAVVGSHNALTTAALSNHSHGNPTLALTNLTGATASNSAGFTLSLEAAAQGATSYLSRLNGSSGAVSLNVGSSLSSSTNGSSITFGLASNITTALQAAGAYLTTARASNDAVGLNTAFTAGPLAWTVNSSGLSLNAGSAAGTTTGFTGGALITGSMTHNTAGLALALSHPVWLTTAALSNHSHGDPTLALTNLSGTTASNSAGFTLSLAAAAPGAAAEANAINLLGNNTAGNTTATGSTIGWSGVNLTFSGTNNSQVVVSAPATSSLYGVAPISISSNGSTISVSYVAATQSGGYFPYADVELVGAQQGNGTVMFDPERMPNVQFDRLLLPIIFTGATNSTASVTASFYVGFYTKNASTLSLLTSSSSSTAFTHSGTAAGSWSLHSGMRLFSIPMTYTLLENTYWIAHMSRTTTGGGNASLSGMHITNIASNFVGMFGASHNTTMQMTLGQGVYSATSAALPGSVAFSQIRGSDSIAMRPLAIAFGSGTI
jgi:hypothetical protein